MFLRAFRSKGRWVRTRGESQVWRSLGEGAYDLSGSGEACGEGEALQRSVILSSPLAKLKEQVEFAKGELVNAIAISLRL